MALTLRDGNGTVASNHWIDYEVNGFKRQVEVAIPTTLRNGVGVAIVLPSVKFRPMISEGIPPPPETSLPLKDHRSGRAEVTAPRLFPAETAPVLAAGLMRH